VAGGAVTTQVETLTNNGTAPLNVTGITITGTNASDFTQTNTCSTAVAVKQSCSITVSFTATTVGSYAATMNITNNGSTSGTVAVTLSGATVVSLNPLAILNLTTVTFPSVSAGGSGSTQTVKLTNTGAAALSIASIAMSGTGANLFSETNGCGTTLAAGANCILSIGFAPKVSGTYSATLTVTDNAGGTAGTTQTVAVSGTATPYAITIDNTNPIDWKINNGAMALDWNSTNAGLWGVQMVGYPDQLVDMGHTGSGGQPYGLYMDNTGVGSGTTSATYTLGSGGSYLDWSMTTVSNATTNAFTYSEHFVVYPNDPGVHLYFVVNHATTDIAGGLGQIQYVFRDSLTQFTNTYTVDEGLGNPGVQILTLPSVADTSSTDPGRAVQNAVEDLHGFTDLPANYTREFETKYDYVSYEYLHQAHGLFGSTYGVWTVLPVHDTQPGGPTKQSLIFTDNLLMMEAWSGHVDNPLAYNFLAGTAGSHLFGPFYIHFNTFGQAYTQTANTLATPADMYADALQAGANLKPLYDTEPQLLAAGYVPSTQRGTVSIQVNGVTGAAHTAWAVLSDPATNFQVSTAGYEYWADISHNGSATITGVAPGTYRLSVYVLGQWGELRQENVVVTANQTTTVPAVTFVPENFGTGTPVFAIGSPDRSAHEFLHGHYTTGATIGNDDREYGGAWNYWADFAANQGAVVYNATSGPNGAATNDLTKWNYNHWGSSFDPGLYDPTDDTTDGYSNTANMFGNGIPTYVAGLPGAKGTNGVGTGIPAWQVHFATPATQTGTTALPYVVLSVSVACAEGSYVISLNGRQEIWYFTNASDCMIRSALSGYTQWFAMQWPASDLNAPGADNVISIGMSQANGSSDDALRLELSNTGANPATTGWNDYTYITGTGYPGTGTVNSSGLYNNDALPNP
jgi:hypothetical protein